MFLFEILDIPVKDRENRILNLLFFSQFIRFVVDCFFFNFFFAGLNLYYEGYYMYIKT